MLSVSAVDASDPRPPWWQQRQALQRFVSDLLADELTRLRCGAAGLPPLPWPDDCAIDRDLGADSLELMALATSLAEAIQLHRSGVEDYLLAKRTLADWVDVAQHGLAHFSDELTFRTSGSTGAPKTCVHPLAALQQETAELASLFHDRRRILTAVPGHHIYGFLFTVLLPQALGLAPDSTVDLRGSSPARLARLLQPGDLVVGHPDFWQALTRSVPQVAPGVIGVTSTAPCPDHISDAVEQAGIASLFHIYGSSETAGIGWRTSCREPYRLFSYWSAVGGQGNTLERRSPDGAPQVMICQDRIDWHGADRFLVGARHDAAVQVGGVNVFPSRVSEALRQHPGVQQATVRLMRPDEGNRLKAFVVPAPDVTDTGLLASELARWIESTLPVAERPKAICIGPRLPVSPSGKQSDWHARDALAFDAADDAA